MFLDEISMIDLHEFYRICEQMSLARDKPKEAFGGINIIAAGDFAQLPPPGWGASSLYSTSVGVKTPGLATKAQKRALSKALWHMITTVVILRQNMRQTGVSEADREFRIALDNMRYG